jgi:hypothetical protein
MRKRRLRVDTPATATAVMAAAAAAVVDGGWAGRLAAKVNADYLVHA